MANDAKDARGGGSGGKGKSGVNSGDSLPRIAATLERIESLLSAHFSPPTAGQLASARYWRWQATAAEVGGGRLTPLPAPPPVAFGSLIGLDDAIAQLKRNTQKFLQGKPAAHALLTGARGCGKSTLIRAVLSHYARSPRYQNKLRMIETDTLGLAALAHLLPSIHARANAGEKVLIYCDDLSFPNNDSPQFNQMKTAIEGTLLAPTASPLIYATSNRRHGVAESFADNFAAMTNSGVGSGDLHPLETVDEKIALADRFGLWIPFDPISQSNYDCMVRHWLAHYGIPCTDARLIEARRYADSRGTFNGRMAHHFATLTVK